MDVLTQLLLGSNEAAESVDEVKLLESYQRLYQQATSAYNEIRIAPELFAEYLGQRLSRSEAIENEVAEFPAAKDLYLACGCSHGDSNALRAFYREYESHLRALLSRLQVSGDRLDGLVTLVCEKLLVRSPDRAPRIAEYQGRGQLLTWLRVVAIRTAISELRRKPHEVADEEVLRNVVSPHANPQRALLKADAQSQIKSAFHQAMKELTTRQRNLLRQHLIDNLTIDDLGSLYQVHRVTAARWLSKARALLWSKTKKLLRAELGISPPQIDSLLGEIRSTLDLSIERALAE